MEPSLSKIPALQMKKSRRPWVLVLESIFRNPLAIIGIILFLILVLVTIFAPLISPYDPLKIHAKLITNPHPGLILWERTIWGAKCSAGWFGEDGNL